MLSYIFIVVNLRIDQKTSLICIWEVFEEDNGELDILVISYTYLLAKIIKINLPPAKGINIGFPDPYNS